MKNNAKTDFVSPCLTVLHLAEHGSLFANIPFFLFCSLPDLDSKVLLLLCHWFGIVLPGGLVDEVWFWLTVIFEIHHLFFKDYFCTILGSCWFFLLANVQDCITLGRYLWRTKMKSMGGCRTILWRQGHLYSFNWANQRKRLWSHEIQLERVGKAMNAQFLPLGEHSKRWRLSFRG